MVVSAQEIPKMQPSDSTEAETFKLYPNPVFNDVVYINTIKNQTKDITVYDVFGKIMLRDRIANNTLNISPLVPGVYVLQVVEHEKTMRRKLVVK